MLIEREKIRKGLKEKGFVEVSKKKDHDFYYLYVEGKKRSIFTKLSRGSGFRDYSDGLVRDVYRQIGLSKEDFLRYLDCSLTLDRYIQMLREQNRLT